MDLNKTILITGANGQLGMELRELARNFPEYSFLFVSRSELDITDEESVDVFFEKHTIQYCINCAAYTAVDKSETELQEALAGNALAPGFLAKACHAKGAVLFHFSTDYVFNGQGTAPYKTDDKTEPVNFYGKTKMEGEQAVLKYPEHFVIRTSWVYSIYGKNFVKTMIGLMQSRDVIQVVNDQTGCPTYAADLAHAVMQIIHQGAHTGGVYHYSNKGSITWYDFAVAIQQLSEINCIVEPISGSKFPTPAKRPTYSVMDTSLIERTFNLHIPGWRERLEVCIGKLKAQGFFNNKKQFD